MENTGPIPRNGDDRETEPTAGERALNAIEEPLIRCIASMTHYQLHAPLMNDTTSLDTHYDPSLSKIDIPDNRRRGVFGFSDSSVTGVQILNQLHANGEKTLLAVHSEAQQAFNTLKNQLANVTLDLGLTLGNALRAIANEDPDADKRTTTARAKRVWESFMQTHGDDLDVYMTLKTLNNWMNSSATIDEFFAEHNAAVATRDDAPKGGFVAALDSFRPGRRTTAPDNSFDQAFRSTLSSCNDMLQFALDGDNIHDQHARLAVRSVGGALGGGGSVYIIAQSLAGNDHLSLSLAALAGLMGAFTGAVWAYEDNFYTPTDLPKKVSRAAALDRKDKPIFQKLNDILHKAHERIATQDDTNALITQAVGRQSEAEKFVKSELNRILEEHRQARNGDGGRTTP